MTLSMGSRFVTLDPLTDVLCPDFASFLKISVGCYRRCRFDGIDAARDFVSLVGSVGSIVSYCRDVEMNRVTEE